MWDSIETTSRNRSLFPHFGHLSFRGAERFAVFVFMVGARAILHVLKINATRFPVLKIAFESVNADPARRPLRTPPRPLR